MAHNSGCVWIDHREARIFGVSADDADETVIRDEHAPAHIHRRADHVHKGKADPDRAFLEEVAASLGRFRGIIIMGPGTARTELAGYLAEAHPVIARRVWGIEPMDHPSDAEIIAAARKYFRGANRMHSL
ncbi:MAG TPA: translational machinery protein [Devosia sp.]|nr:translational machinery protein [Devosia sp.]